MKQRTRLMHSGDDLSSYNMNKKADGDVNGEIQLHKVRPQEHYIEAQVQEGDTLQAIALRFYCSISELKRINHIHKDNEIFARRTIKVPVTPYSVLTELIPTSYESAPATTSYVAVQSNPLETGTIVPGLTLNNTHSELHAVPNHSSEAKDNLAIDCNSIVLNSTLAPSVIPYTDGEPTEAISEDTQLLPNKPREPVEAVVVKELTSHGADFGLKWFHLVCFMLILGVVVPLVYIMFYLKPEHPIETKETG